MKMAIFLALVHHPVLDRSGRVVTTALTNVDVHDLARSGRTFGVSRSYVVTPVALQQRLVHEMVGHWQQGAGSAHLRRAEAMQRVSVAPSLDAVRTDITQRTGRAPVIAVTAARWQPEGMKPSMQQPESFALWRRKIATAGDDAQPLLLVFGTGWGLAPEVLLQADVRLPPVQRQPELLDPEAGDGPYNHLSVRAAAAIILDRLLGDRDEP